MMAESMPVGAQLDLIVSTKIVLHALGTWLQGNLGTGAGTQSPQERTPTQVPSDEHDEEMTYDQRRLIRRFRKGGRPSTELGIGVTKSKAFKG
jgi:hypothetical protein